MSGARCESRGRSPNRIQQPGDRKQAGEGASYRLSGRHRVSATDDNLGRFARLDRDRGAVGHNAQRRLHAMNIAITTINWKDGCGDIKDVVTSIVRAQP